MATAPIDRTFYADPSGLNALRHDARAQDPQALKTAARQFESLFTSMMLKSMRDATPKDTLMGSDQQDFYQDMFDSQLATQLSKGKGLGLADVLVQQLMKGGVGGPVAPVADKAADAAAPATALKPTAAAWPPATRADFVQALLPAATAAGQRLGVEPGTLIAHAALETGWGRSMPRNADGSCSFNLFGIKAGASWSGPVAVAPTTEVVNGQPQSVQAGFRSYASPEDCLNDYASLLAGRPRYTAALGTGSDVQAFAQGLQQGGYATDPDYVGKLTAVARELKSRVAAPITVSEFS
jgi:flagellar protein FlgJ